MALQRDERLCLVIHKDTACSFYQAGEPPAPQGPLSKATFCNWDIMTIRQFTKRGRIGLGLLLLGCLNWVVNIIVWGFLIWEDKEIGKNKGILFVASHFGSVFVGILFYFPFFLRIRHFIWHSPFSGSQSADSTLLCVSRSPTQRSWGEDNRCLCRDNLGIDS